MPIYEYSCTKCDNKFELLCPIANSNDDAECPVCNKTAKRILSRFVSHVKDSSAGFGDMTSSGGSKSSCSSCSSTNCASCHG